MRLIIFILLFSCSIFESKAYNFVVGEKTFPKIAWKSPFFNFLDDETVFVGQNVAMLKGKKDYHFDKKEFLFKTKLSSSIKKKILANEFCSFLYTTPAGGSTYCKVSNFNEASIYLIYYNCETGYVYGFVRIIA